VTSDSRSFEDKISARFVVTTVCLVDEYRSFSVWNCYSMFDREAQHCAIRRVVRRPRTCISTV